MDMTHARNTALIRQHLHDLRRRGLSEGTTNNRRIKLTAFLSWVEPRLLLDVEHHDIQRFLDGRNLNARTRYQWVSHLHNFYRWAVLEGHTDTDPTVRIIRPKLPRLLPRPIADDDLERAIAVAPAQMKAWLILAAYAGLRCAEIAGLDVTDVLLADRLLLIRGKGAKERIVPMHPMVEAELRTRCIRRSGPVFVHEAGGRFKPEWISRRGSRFLRDLGLNETMHSLRHWFGSRTYAECRDIRVVQELMGHADPVTTAGYAAFSPTTARAAVVAI